MSEPTDASIEFTVTPDQARELVLGDLELQEALDYLNLDQRRFASPRVIVALAIADAAEITIDPDSPRASDNFEDGGPEAQSGLDQWTFRLHDDQANYGLAAFEGARKQLRDWKITYTAYDGGSYDWSPYRVTSANGNAEWSIETDKEGGIVLTEEAHERITEGCLDAEAEDYEERYPSAEAMTAELIAAHFLGKNWRHYALKHYPPYYEETAA